MDLKFYILLLSKINKSKVDIIGNHLKQKALSSLVDAFLDHKTAIIDGCK